MLVLSNKEMLWDRNIIVKQHENKEVYGKGEH